jgi:hypothetical protein
MAAITVKFDGPYGLTSRTTHPLVFEQAIAAEQGIYLWAIPYRSGGYLVSYVGETGASFGRRLREHVIQTMGGNYRICNSDLLVQGQAEVLWNGLWRRGTQHKTLEYLEEAERFAPLARRELQLTTVFAAPLHIPVRVRRRIEAGLAPHIRSQGDPASSLLPGDIRYHPRRDSEDPVPVEVRCPELVHGLPNALEVSG